jgi:hypothetical protein
MERGTRQGKIVDEEGNGKGKIREKLRQRGRELWEQERIYSKGTTKLKAKREIIRRGLEVNGTGL